MKRLFAVAFGSTVALLAALVVLLAPGQAGAQLDPAAICANTAQYGEDADGDGFLNGEECTGFTKDLNAGVYTTISGWQCTQNCTAEKLNPAKRDLFVVLVRAAIGNIPTQDPYEYIKADPPGGLGTNVHEVPDADVRADRLVIYRSPTSFQKAVKVTESLSASPVLGKCDEAWATPNGLDNCFVFTKAIKDHVDAKCASLSDKNKCKDSVTGYTPLTTPSIYDLYIKHTLAHECGHDMKLRGIYVSSTGGYHYASTDKVVVSQSVFYKASKSAVTWYIGKIYYSPNDQQDFTLWEFVQ